MTKRAKVAFLVQRFAENQVSGNCEAFEAAYDALLEIGPPVISFLSDIVADSGSLYRVAAIDLLECFHPVLDSSSALPVLRKAMTQPDPWLRLCAAEAVWIVDGKSPKDIAPDALEIIRESAESDLVQVRDRARRTMKTVREMEAVG